MVNGVMIKLSNKENLELRKIIKQWEIDNMILQESLDSAQREIERLNKEICDNKLCINLEGE